MIGAMVSPMNLVQLKPRNSGCDLEIRMGFTGNDDEGAFRHRIDRALKKLDAAKASARANSAQAQ